MGGYFNAGFYFTVTPLDQTSQMNKCLRENQKLWQDQLQKMEEKFVERETERRKV